MASSRTGEVRSRGTAEHVPTSVVVLVIGFGLKTTLQRSRSRLRLGGVFAASCLGLGLDGLRIFDQDRSRLMVWLWNEAVKLLGVFLFFVLCLIQK